MFNVVDEIWWLFDALPSDKNTNIFVASGSIESLLNTLTASFNPSLIYVAATALKSLIADSTVSYVGFLNVLLVVIYALNWTIVNVTFSEAPLPLIIVLEKLFAASFKAASLEGNCFPHSSQ